MSAEVSRKRVKRPTSKSSSTLPGMLVTEVLRFSGSKDLRETLLLSTLSGKPVKISEIRPHDMNQPGLRNYEISLLRLFEKVSSGCKITIDATGTHLSYKPGALTSGGFLSHKCDPGQGLGYYIEPLIFIALFGKETLEIDLEGITNDNKSLSVDLIRTVVLPFLDNFGVDTAQAELRVVKRGAPPLGGGLVHLKIPVIRERLESVQLTQVGLIRRVRGIAYSAKVSPHLANRTIEGARDILKHLCKDIFIHADHFKGSEAGASPGYGLTLVAESSTGAQLGTERFAVTGDSDLVAEDLGTVVAKQLVLEILRSSFVDSSAQWIALLLMTLTARNVSKIVLGDLTPFTIRILRKIKEFFGVEFKFEVEDNGKSVHLSCVGAGFQNLNRKYS